MDRGGESCKGVDVAEVIRSNISSYTIFDLFIFSVSKPPINAASHDGEIWHADA